MKNKNKIWFAEKQNGEIITLNEEQALTHFKRNNISARMRLKFLGTSDGSIYEEGQKKASNLIDDKMKEEYEPSEIRSLKSPQNKADYYAIKMDLVEKHKDEIEKIKNKAFEDELNQAKENGVEEPNRGLDVMTPNKSGRGVSSKRQQILREIRPR